MRTGGLKSGTIRRDPAGLRGRRDDSRTGEEAMAHTGAWCARHSPARFRQSGKGTRGEHPKLDPLKEAIDGMLAGAGGDKPRGSSGAPRTGLDAPVRGTSATRSPPSPPCVDTYGDGNRNWGSAAGRSSCRRATSGARKLRSIGLKRWRNSMEKLARCSSSRCAVWRRATRFIGRIRTPRSKHCLKDTNSLRLLRRSLPQVALRQHDLGGEEDSTWPTANRDRPDHRIPLPLGISERVLQPG